MNLFFRKSEAAKQAEFWQWFGANCHRFPGAYERPEFHVVMDEISNRLHKVDKRLAFEMLAKVAETQEFIISAEGNTKVFPAVQSLVDAAPLIPGWKIIAFRQRNSASVSIQMNDLELGPENVWFILHGDGNKIGIEMFLLNLPLNDMVKQASFILLDNALGEYDVETRVGFLDWQAVLEPPAEAKPFDKLPEAFDAYWTLLLGH